MKKSILLIVAIFTISLSYSQDVTLTTQAEVDAYTGGATVNGSLIIGMLDDLGYVVQTDITTLDPINNIVEITGDLNIYGNLNLTNLSGLSNVETFDGFISLYWNGLTEITGLSKISGAIGLLYVEYNSALGSLSGLDEVTSINGYCYIANNDILSDLTGFGKLETITDFLWIQNNDDLVDVDGLNSLTSIGGSLTINLNDGITSLNGFSKLSDVQGDINIQSNSELISLMGFASDVGVTAVSLTTGRIQIDANPKLADISGFEKMTSGDITTLTIRNNTVLSTCEIINFCTFLNTAGIRIIFGNATGCQDNTAVLAACASLSVSDYLLENALSVYPNPVNDLVYIEKLSNIDIQNIQLYNAQGVLVKESKMVDDQLDVSNISAGMYILRITTNDGIATQKLIKQ